MTEDLRSIGAAELARQIRSGARSPTDVIEATLSRIHARNDAINAFITVCDEQAQAAAEEVGAAIDRGEDPGPLAGVPVGIKDLTNVAHVPTTFGSVPLQDTVPDVDDVLVRRLREAGAIIVGKTNTPEFGRKTVTENHLVGATHNPWDHSRIVGGSSGGSGAALADGQVPLAQGTDAAGSIRVPSAACGTVGIMPDFGRVPLGNSRPDAFVNTHPYGYAGPMARRVEDVALGLDVMAGPDPADPFSLPEQPGSYTDALDAGVSGLRVAFSPDLGICRVAEAVRAETADAVSAFEGAGVDVERATPDFGFDYEGLHEAIVVLLRERYIGLYESLKEGRGIDLLDSSLDVTPEVVDRVEKAHGLGPGDVRRAERIRTTAYDALQSFLGEWDLLVTPTIGRPAFELGDDAPLIDGKAVDPNHGWVLTWPFNLTGNPVAAVPAGTVDGLPVGLQIVGRRLHDRDVVRAAAAYERERPWIDDYPSN
ncbi:MAG: amidase [Halobacteriales archaeon]|nr:amidase [Halobacteriales archaeon]